MAPKALILFCLSDHENKVATSIRIWASSLQPSSSPSSGVPGPAAGQPTQSMWQWSSWQVTLNVTLMGRVLAWKAGMLLVGRWVEGTSLCCAGKTFFSLPRLFRSIIWRGSCCNGLHSSACCDGTWRTSCSCLQLMEREATQGTSDRWQFCCFNE